MIGTKLKQILAASLIAFLVYLLLFISAEFICGFLNKARNAKLNESSGFSQPFYINDPTVGYVPYPNKTLYAYRTAGGKPVYRVKYTIDGLSRRITPMKHAESRDQFVLFFGASVPFGEGTNDGTTLPAFFANAAPDYYPYNYSGPGYGPQEMLAYLEKPNFKKGISQKNGMAVYFLHNGDVQRAIGSMLIYNSWGHVMPYYKIEKGQLARKGFFKRNRPVLDKIYTVLGKSQILKYFEIDFPHRMRRTDVDLVFRIIKQSRDLFKQKFGSDRFYVIILPEETDIGPKIIPYFKSSEIKYLDYSGWNMTKQNLRLESDGHPTAKGYMLLAMKLGKDLNAIESTAQAKTLYE